MGISVIKKRDGRIVPFDVQKITKAIQKSFLANDAGQDREDLSTDLALKVYTLLDLEGDPAPTVEHVQDIVEQVLMREGHTQTAKNYILYRQERSRIRQRSDEDASRFGGAPVSLTESLAGCESIEAAVFAAFLLLQERHGHTVSDFPHAMVKAVAGSFYTCYCQAQKTALELHTGRPVHKTTQQAWAGGLAQKGLKLTLAGEAEVLSREADLICGTLGCDRAAVKTVQELSLRRAKEDVTAMLCDAITRLCAAAGIEKTALQGSAEGAEEQLVAELLK